MIGLPNTAERFIGGWIASNTSLKIASPPRIRSRVNLWKFAFSSVVHNASCAVDVVPVAIFFARIPGVTKEISNSKILLLQHY